MGTTGIPQLRAHLQGETETSLLGWEQHFFQAACRQAQRAAQEWLEGIDALLLAHKPEDWRVVGKWRRTLVTRFGKVTFEPRLYRDEEGRYGFLLDEVLEYRRIKMPLRR